MNPDPTSAGVTLFGRVAIGDIGQFPARIGQAAAQDSTRPTAATCRNAQSGAGTDFAKSAHAMVSFFNLGPYTCVRVELVALTPTGPYRLQVDHPARKLVEYFETPFAALLRHAEIESALCGKPSPSAS